MPREAGCRERPGANWNQEILSRLQGAPTVTVPNPNYQKKKNPCNLAIAGVGIKSLAVTYFTPGILPYAPSGPASHCDAVQNRSRQFCHIPCSSRSQTGFKTKKYPATGTGYCFIKSLAVTYFHMGTPTLSSALSSFTSEFEMGSGGSHLLMPPGKLVRRAQR